MIPKATEPSNRAAFGRLVGFVVGGIVLAWLFHGLAVLLVIMALVVMVMIHELGHFMTAKLSKMKVTEYFLGFGPTVWSVRRGETSYGVKAIPAGGYVRIVGMTNVEEVDIEDEPRTYRQATFPRRLLVAVAGSAMHFVMAFLLLWAMFSFTGMPSAGPANQIGSLTSFVGMKSPAQLAKLRPGDLLLGANGHYYKSISKTIHIIESSPMKKVSLIVKRKSHVFNVVVRPVNGTKVHVDNGGVVTTPKHGKHTIGVIGVTLGVVEYTKTNPLTAVGRSVTAVGSFTAQTFDGIGSVFSASGLRSFAHSVATAGSSQNASSSTGQSSSSSGSSGTQVTSIIGIVQLGSQLAGHHLAELLELLVLVNLFIGIVNLFPMLPLDGGHVVIAVYERLRSTRKENYHADVTKLMPVAYAFIAFLVVMGLSALYVNIVHPL